jgi:hypothetical protein
MRIFLLERHGNMMFSILTPLYLLDLGRRVSEVFYQFIRLEAIQGLLEGGRWQNCSINKK